MDNTDLLTEKIIRGMQEKRARGVTVVDLRETEEAVCRAFVIATATSPTQAAAIAESVADVVRREAGARPAAVAGLREAMWVAMDYTDVIVHIFLPDMRQFYDLEHLWADARLTEITDED